MPAPHVIEDRARVAEKHDEILQDYVWELRRQLRNGDWDFARACSLMGILRAEQLKREKAAEALPVEDDEETDDKE